jgi:hypothetical protein
MKTQKRFRGRSGGGAGTLKKKKKKNNIPRNKLSLPIFILVSVDQPLFDGFRL